MCSISKCHGSYKDIGVTLHRLPKDDSQRIQWEGNVKNHTTNFCSRKNIFICSRHFLQECFYKILSNDQADTLSEMQSPIMMEKKSTNEPTGIDALTPRSLKRKAKKLDISLKTTRKVLYNYNKKTKRLKVKLEVYRNEIEMLKKYNDELTSTLLSYSDIPTKLFMKLNKTYTEEQKRFALTLHLYGGKSYQFLKCKGLHLPHKHTLARWLESVDGGPGLNRSMLNFLKKKHETDAKQFTHCSLMIDSMSIRKQLIYLKHKGVYSGYEHFGGDYTSNELATQALVLMIVGTSVKLVAYILSNSVAKALRCSSNCEEFRDCGATVQFLEKMDILNTCVLGMVVNIETIINLATSLLQTQKYVLAYKFSQDHLELFFNFIRSVGRSNDNPNVQQLHSIFKKVYYRCGIVPGKTGNVQEQMIVESEFKVPEDQFKDIFEETYLDSQIMTSNTMSTVIENPSNTMSTIIDSAVAYIAGWVVRKVAKTIDCNKCRFALIDIKGQATMLHQQLLILKDNGGLVFPSCGVVQVRK
ncbi:hypothetical protein HELRODRAFT_175877 [Helobdella robusta]|uniref:THAP-type domain-containing protein n=1 Tax=Helobdella robusta TaxID=6412 RepID=T1F9T5_HELRO|nr:hypothetical protein HELRODRAFT_175877 [Helobdella robusta]ESO00445.1 hypothetical protein HELRODRAFT_175877 [Helobdella robusta]